MDYYYYSSDGSPVGYIKLFSNFYSISNVLLEKLKQFESNGFKPDLGYMMGHSFGAQLVINAGRDFGGKLDGIDGMRCCLKCSRN